MGEEGGKETRGHHEVRWVMSTRPPLRTADGMEAARARLKQQVTRAYGLGVRIAQNLSNLGLQLVKYHVFMSFIKAS